MTASSWCSARGGDRPKMRRVDMAREAAKYADFAVVTVDNPDGAGGGHLRRHHRCPGRKIPSVEIYDRRQAIFYALDMARSGDIVALLGKGHEEYIETNGVRRHFSEREVLDEYFAAPAGRPAGAPLRIQMLGGNEFRLRQGFRQRRKHLYAPTRRGHSLPVRKGFAFLTGLMAPCQGRAPLCHFTRSATVWANSRRR